MKRVKLLSLLAVVLLFTGCQTTGLSVRETGHFQYTNFVYGLYDYYGQDEAPEVKMQGPITVAIAQVGETAPSQQLLERLAKEKGLISKLEELPVGGELNTYSSDKNNFYQKSYRGGTSNAPASSTQGQINGKMDKMRRIAKDMGVEYIFLYGGSADEMTSGTWLQVLDFTVIGGFIFPSQNIYMEGKASGALVHVETGKVMLVVSSEEKLRSFSPTFTLDGHTDQVSVKLRDKLVASLSEKFIEKLKATL